LISKETYQEYIKYRDILQRFKDTGHYVGGADALFNFMQIPKKNCDTCKAQALIEAQTQIELYESKDS